MMNEIPALAIALAAGAGLGLVFFGGLWLTLLRLPSARRPALLALGSLAGRIVIAVGGFYLIMDGSWQRLLACVVGFLLARQWVMRRLSPPLNRPSTAEVSEVHT